MEILYGLGWTYRDVIVTPFRDLMTAVRAYSAKEQRADRRTLSVVNHIRGAVGADPIEDPGLEPDHRRKAKTKADREAAQAVIDKWSHLYQ